MKSSPTARATLTEAPARVDLWFNERLEPAYSRVTVVDGLGVRVDLGSATVSPDDAKRLSVPLPTLGPGRYTVRYRVLSVDGHVVESSLTFTVRPRPTP